MRRLHCGYTVTHSKTPYCPITLVPPDGREGKLGPTLLSQRLLPADAKCPARYCQARGLFGDLDFLAMKETQPDELFAAWLYLPDGQRNEMDAKFRDIF